MRLTGITAHTLRVWEKRYGAVQVGRTATDRRLYSADAVRRLMLIKRLVDGGEPISRVATLDNDALEARLAALALPPSPNAAPATAPQRLAVLGATLAGRLTNLVGAPPVVLAETDPDMFLDKLGRSGADTVVVETDFVSAETPAFIDKIQQHSGGARTLLVYGFGRSADVKRVAGRRVTTLRAPVSVDEIGAALRPPSDGGATARPAAAPARRFSDQQLARMATAATTVECECPTHLVDLVVGLAAFEAYSADCEHRNPADAALHAYLQTTTAAARSLLEEALEHVARAEGLLPEQAPGDR